MSALWVCHLPTIIVTIMLGGAFSSLSGNRNSFEDLIVVDLIKEMSHVKKLDLMKISCRLF